MSMAGPERIEQLTRSLVSTPSVNERRIDGKETPFQETALANQLQRWFAEHQIAHFSQELPDGRKNIFAFVPGKSERTVVLAGHFDTVGVDDYTRKGQNPFDPEQLAMQQPEYAEDFLVGRGAFDMKSGIAVAMTLMDEFQQRDELLDGSVLFVATCDEENNSYGILNAVDVLRHAQGSLKDGSSVQESIDRMIGGRELDFQGVINLDYTTQRFPGDTEHHVWAGTIGKMLPSVFVRGKETHAGEHFNGFHASSMLSRITSAVEGNMALVDGSVPPTALHMTDNRDGYDVMTPSTGRAYYNVFSVGRTPSEVMEGIEQVITGEISAYSESIDQNYKSYCDRMGMPYEEKDWKDKVKLLRYSDLIHMSKEALGDQETEDIIQGVISSQYKDSRESSFAIVERLVNELQLADPTVVLFYSPPFYPYIRPEKGRLTDVTDSVIQQVGEEQDVTITRHDFYPYISDMSYLKIEPEIAKSLDGLIAEMPVWNRGYSLDLNAIADLNLSVVDVGPYGFGAHQTEERVERRYTFEILPEILKRMVVDLLMDEKKELP